MNQKLIPFITAKNLFEIPVDFYKKIGVKNLLLDLDNTLDSYLDKVPTKRTIDYVNLLKEQSLNVYIISNNKKKRVLKYAEKLDIPFLYKSFKPFSFKIKKFLLKNNFILNETILIGDQILTDIKAANNIGIKSIYLEKLVPIDQWTTRINRVFEKPILKRLKSKNLLIDWRAKYGNH